MVTAGLGLAAAAASSVADGLLPLGAARLCVFESTPATSPRRPPPLPCRLLMLLSSSSSCFRSLDRDDVSGYPLYCPRPIIRFRRFLSSINPPTTEQTRRTRIPITRPATAPPLIPLLSSVFESLVAAGMMLERVLVIGLRLRGVVLAVCAVEAGSDVVVAIGGMRGVVAVGKGKNVDGVRVAGGAGSAMVDLKKKRKN
ncbi:hypothetical protein BKA57DRAFT_446409, partial [Linnemannia elongata]